MNGASIHRQDEETSMVELVGLVCDEFLAVYNDRLGRYVIFYIKLSAIFHRFYLDAGLLFWQSHESPDSENDLLEGDDYVDFGKKFGVIGAHVSRIEMSENRLDIEFDNSARIALKNEVRGYGAELISASDCGDK